MPARLRVGVAGAGHWGAQVHAPGVMAHPDAVLSGIWNRDPDRAAALAVSTGVPAFARFADLLAASDAISFAVAPDIQARLAIEAAAAGRHVLLEKPLALGREEGEAVARAIDAAGVASVMFLTRRFIPEIRDALARLAEQSWEGGVARLLAGALLEGSPYAGSLWRQRHGALWDLAPHALSLLIPVLGPVTHVTAARDAARVTRLGLRHGQGGRSEVAVSLHAAAEDREDVVLFRQGAEEARLPGGAAPRLAAYGKALSALMDAIRTGTADACDAGFGLAVIRVLLAAEASLVEGGERAVT
jgi:predicted dehydrogenase